MEDDCFAARLAAALRRRFGQGARALAEGRLSRAIARHEIVKADLYLAVTVVLGDRDGVFSRSRR